jgi:hypothetical protein
MNGYSENRAIYFQIGTQTAFAIYPTNEEKILSGKYQGEPPYRRFIGTISEEHKKYHEAEHQIYNCFINKIKDLHPEAKLSEFAEYLPSIEEAQRTDSFSVFCGTSFYLSSAVLLIGSGLINFSNANWQTRFIFLFLLMALFILLSYIIQKIFYLKKADSKHLKLAREALKEALKNE